MVSTMGNAVLQCAVKSRPFATMGTTKKHFDTIFCCLGLTVKARKNYRAPTDFRPLRHIFVHFCGLPTAFMMH